jgi:hypothetical protein
MVNNFEEVFVQLPSPPLSPSKLCNERLSRDEYGLSMEEYKDKFNNNNDNELFFEEFLNSERFDYSDEELLKIEALIGCPIENQYQPSREEILRKKFTNILKNGVEINGKIDTYSKSIEKLHNIGSSVFNKKTENAVILRVYEDGNNRIQEFWVHPVFLSLQSFPFFKLFETIKENNVQGTIEIKVSSLKIFTYVLYYLYTGIKTDILELSKSDENFYRAILLL